MFADIMIGEFIIAESVPLLDAYKPILEAENASESEIDNDGLKYFIQQCDYLDIVIGNHKDPESTRVVFKIDEERNVIAVVSFNGRPRTDLLSYQLLKLTSLEDRLIDEGNGMYTLILNLGSFINY